MAYDVSPSEFERGYKAYQENDLTRDAAYKVARFWVDNFWGKSQMADGMGVLLLTWNASFYRYGLFDFANLEAALQKNMPTIEKFRTLDLVKTDIELKDYEADIMCLFQDFLTALKITKGKKEIKSPVSVAKALHLLAPKFFPIWDYKIATAYKCYYSNPPPEQKYVDFVQKMKTLAQQLQVQGYVPPSDKSFLKLIDEYNYMKYTNTKRDNIDRSVGPS
jgi:hypothetical protein